MTLRKQPVCTVCRKAVSDTDEYRVPLIKPEGRSVVFACAKHRPAVELGVAVGRAAVRAGFEAALEVKAPGLLGRVQRAVGILRGKD